MFDTTSEPEDDNTPIPVFPYKISYGLEDTDNPYVPANPTSELAELINELMEEAFEPTKRTPERIQKAMAKYPRQPQFHNFLSTAYIMLGKNTKAMEVHRRTYAKFPDYLYARLGMAQYELKKGNYDKIPYYLGESLRLEDLYPKRKVFDVTEVLNYYQLVGIYHADTDDLDAARETLYLMDHIDSDARQTETLSKYILSMKIKLAQESIENMYEEEITLPDRKFHYENQTETPPVFHHQEIQWLYDHDYRMPAENIQIILSLPRKTLIEDLEAVLEDGIRRFGYWYSKEWEFQTHTFVIHAIILLGELKATESLPAVLNQLRQGDEYNNFWFSDWVDDIFPTPLYLLAREQTEVLRDFAIEPLIEAYQKNQAVKPMGIIALLEPNRRTEVIEWYEEVIRYFIEHKSQEDLLDTAFLSYLINEAADAGLSELKPLIKELYDQDLVSLDIQGDWEDLEPIFEQDTAKNILTWYYEDGQKQYAHLTKELNQIEKRDREYAERLTQQKQLQDFDAPSRTSHPSYEPAKVEKIGRNERVSVKYADGTIKTDVKYKSVEQDVESGKATIIR